MGVYYGLRREVSIIPTREGWVVGLLGVSRQDDCFNHPNPRGLGPESQLDDPGGSSFNHPNLRGLGL